MFSKLNVQVVLVPFLLATTTTVVAICPGFNFAIGNVIPQGQIGDAQVNRCMSLSARNFKLSLEVAYRIQFFPVGNVYDDSCNVVDGLTTTGNPCDEGIFGCTPPPILFDLYTSTFTGLM
jgi:hypothetical protein